MNVTLLYFSQTGKQKPLIAYGLVPGGVCYYSGRRSAEFCYCFATYKRGSLFGRI